MNWLKFTTDIPKNQPMLFWKEGNWFDGELVQDSEYGLVISIEETYVSIKGVTHYMIIVAPE